MKIEQYTDRQQQAVHLLNESHNVFLVWLISPGSNMVTQSDKKATFIVLPRLDWDLVIMWYQGTLRLLTLTPQNV